MSTACQRLATHVAQGRYLSRRGPWRTAPDDGWGDAVQHFAHLGEEQVDALFHRTPERIDPSADIATLAMSLGATLYIPADRPTLAEDIRRRHAYGVMSVVVCLEDSIRDAAVPAAERNAVEQLRRFAASHGTDSPLIFVRVRSSEQIARVVADLGADIGVLAGFVLPKFTESSGTLYLEELERAIADTGSRLLAMPVLESPEVIHRETRTECLVGIAQLLAKHREHVLAVRIGATDLCGTYGIRRTRDLTVWDVVPVAQTIADIVNILGRDDDNGFCITGPVWEYFSSSERLFKPQLRQTPFEEHDARRLRHDLLNRDADALIREIVLDRANGLTGKTVIHPTHVPIVHALSVVTHEEFEDAGDICSDEMVGGGVKASGYRNKMNESKPHRRWARRTLLRAQVFGVAAPEVTFVDLLAAGVDA